MLQFQELTAAQGDCLRRYYEACDYRLCEYSLGVKPMWGGHLNPSSEKAGFRFSRHMSFTPREYSHSRYSPAS